MQLHFIHEGEVSAGHAFLATIYRRTMIAPVC